jgi:hypothetical protein
MTFLVRHSAAIALITMAGACDRPKGGDVASTFSETPLAQLRGVSLGASAKEIRAARPNVRISPYIGLSEEISAQSVSYSFGSQAVGESVSDNASLETIMVVSPQPTPAVALQEWEKAVTQASQRFGEPSCARSPTTADAVWEIQRIHFSISARDKMSAGGSQDVPPRLVYRLSSNPDVVSSIQTSTAACKDSTRTSS